MNDKNTLPPGQDQSEPTGQHETLDKNKTPELKMSVLEKIQSGEVTMRPKIYFILKIILLIAVVAGSLLSLSFLMSYLFFSIKISGKLMLLGFGGRGIGLFLMLFPWKILFIFILLAFLLQWLLKKFEFGYRNPFVYLLSGVVLISMMFGFLINFTPLHKVMLRETEFKRPPPLVGGLYRRIRKPSDSRDIFRATIKAIEPERLTVEYMDLEQNEKDPIRKIMVPPEIPRLFKIGDRVFIAGEKIGNQFHVFGIRKIEENDEE